MERLIHQNPHLDGQRTAAKTAIENIVEILGSTKDKTRIMQIARGTGNTWRRDLESPEFKVRETPARMSCSHGQSIIRIPAMINFAFLGKTPLAALQQAVRIQCDHRLGQERAIQRIDAWIRDPTLKDPLPAAVEISEVNGKWVGNLLKLSFQVHKRILGVAITIFAIVEDNSVTLEFEIPEAVRAFVPKSACRDEVKRRLTELLGTKSDEQKLRTKTQLQGVQ